MDASTGSRFNKSVVIQDEEGKGGNLDQDGRLPESEIGKDNSGEELHPGVQSCFPASSNLYCPHV